MLTRRKFLKRFSFISAAAALAPAALIKGSPAAPAKVTVTAAYRSRPGVRPLGLEGIDGDSVLCGGEEVLMFYDDEITLSQTRGKRRSSNLG